MNAHSNVMAGLNWRDQPVITDERLYQIERRACAAEWLARRPLYRDFGAWMVAAGHALEDIDNRREAGREQQRNAFYAEQERKRREHFQ